eukprot:SAG11_NODE_2509_length_3270_cov_4.938190_1_plen_99_part_10
MCIIHITVHGNGHGRGDTIGINFYLRTDACVNDACMRMHAGFRDLAGSCGSCMVHARQCMRDPGILGSRARARRVNHAYHPEWSLTLKFSRYPGTCSQK